MWSESQTSHKVCQSSTKLVFVQELAQIWMLATRKVSIPHSITALSSFSGCPMAAVKVCAGNDNPETHGESSMQLQLFKHTSNVMQNTEASSWDENSLRACPHHSLAYQRLEAAFSEISQSHPDIIHLSLIVYTHCEVTALQGSNWWSSSIRCLGGAALPVCGVIIPWAWIAS